MNFNINIDKKFAFIILGAVLILAGAIYANAYGGFIPSKIGHSLGEIEIETSYSCGAGEYLKSIDLETGGVVCESDVGGVTGLSNCGWEDWTEWIFRPNWAVSICPIEKSLEGWECDWTVNSKENEGIQVLPDRVKCRYNIHGTNARARAYCCEGNGGGSAGYTGLSCSLLNGEGDGCWRTNGESGGLEDDVTVCCVGGIVTKICQGDC